MPMPYFHAKIDGQDLATILAALRYYQQSGQGDPANRTDAIHDIATNCGQEVSLDDDGIDGLCFRLNGAPESPTHDPKSNRGRQLCSCGRYVEDCTAEDDFDQHGDR